MSMPGASSKLTETTDPVTGKVVPVPASQS